MTKQLLVTNSNHSHFYHLVTIAIEKLFSPRHIQSDLAIVSIFRRENVIDNGLKYPRPFTYTDIHRYVDLFATD